MPGEPSRPRIPRTRIALGVAVMAAVLVAWGSLHRGAADHAVAAPVHACDALPADLDAMWNPAARRALIAGNPAATLSAAWLADVIDYYALGWPAQRRAACDQRRPGSAVPAGSAGSPAAAARCLADRRAELATAIAISHQATGEIVAAARALRDPRQCGDRDTAATGAAVAAVTSALAAAQQRAVAHPAVAGSVGAADAAAEAVAMIDRALPEIRNEPDPRALPDYTAALAAKAGYELRAGRPADALETAHSGLVVQERIYGTAHPQLLPFLDTIGAAERALGRLADARATLDRARRLAPQ